MKLCVVLPRLLWKPTRTLGGVLGVPSTFLKFSLLVSSTKRCELKWMHLLGHQLAIAGVVSEHTCSWCGINVSKLSHVFVGRLRYRLKIQ